MWPRVNLKGFFIGLKARRELVDFVCKLEGQDIGWLGHRWMLQGTIKDMESVFSLEPYMDKTLREVLDKSPQA